MSHLHKRMRLLGNGKSYIHMERCTSIRACDVLYQIYGNRERSEPIYSDLLAVVGNVNEFHLSTTLVSSFLISKYTRMDSPLFS
ncbi:unnamed protein product [Calypogeia fissa]